MTPSSASDTARPPSEKPADDRERQAKLKQAYTGSEAENYEDWRADTQHWQREQNIVSDYLEAVDLGAGSRILDVPVGTGRFFPFYRDQDAQVLGVDASPDMLSEARKKAERLGYEQVDLQVGDIIDLEAKDDGVELAVCIRLMNWFDFSGFRRALRELRRVSSRYIIVGIRLSSSRWRFDFLTWLRRAPTAWKHQLTAAYNRVGKSLERKLMGSEPEASTSASPPEADSKPPLIDHPEDAVRDEFRRQNLEIARETQALVFHSEPRLSTFFLSRELPYHIYLLQVEQ